MNRIYASNKYYIIGFLYKKMWTWYPELQWSQGICDCECECIFMSSGQSQFFLYLFWWRKLSSMGRQNEISFEGHMLIKVGGVWEWDTIS